MQVTGQLANLWNGYTRRLEAQPVRTKALTSFLGFMVGDAVAQKIGGEAFDPVRCSTLPCRYSLAIMGLLCPAVAVIVRPIPEPVLSWQLATVVGACLPLPYVPIVLLLRVSLLLQVCTAGSLRTVSGRTDRALVSEYACRPSASVFITVWVDSGLINRAAYSFCCYPPPFGQRVWLR